MPPITIRIKSTSTFFVPFFRAVVFPKVIAHHLAIAIENELVHKIVFIDFIYDLLWRLQPMGHSSL